MKNIEVYLIKGIVQRSKASDNVDMNILLNFLFIVYVYVFGCLYTR